MRNRVINLLKIGVTLLGLVIVIARFDLRAIGVTLHQANLLWLLVGFVLVNASIVLRAYRWQILIRGLHTRVPFSRLVELYYVGSFFNVFLPSGFGGDVVRVLELSRDIPADTATGTVLVDRLSGLMMLFALALLALPFRPPQFPTQLLWFIVIICVAGLVAGFALLEGSALRFLSRILPQRILTSGDGFMLKVSQAVDECGWFAIAGAMLVSLLFNLLQAAWWTTSSLALGLTVSFGYMLLVVPLLSLAMLVPSIGGLGVREFIAPALFAGAGLTPEQAIALTLLVFALERISGLFGGPVYIYATLRDRKEPRTNEQHTADQDAL
ncbi:MAG: lysylphosphatidylglycerol synthase transmembrane domain-containing protein [Candidatus Promineifilaceae bacterium]|nr:lysylphosphatidylglycerol synthase transmembrane domain-containing protein [Candidatus Promineifilaceae bacterium]